MGVEDEIAIVGTGCRFPGADDLEEFWQVLINGENHVKAIPESRWNNSAFYDEDQLAPGKIYVKNAGFMKNHDKWDNRLFGISEVEAIRVDPQQRYVLECVHMALEDGGITRKQINGSNTGVIIGAMNDDYKVMASSDLSEVGGYSATGTASSVLAARVSYVYNLHGTCLTLDTACSSALIAIHLASQSIKTGDCDMMICGGVSSILSPDTFKALCEARMMSAIGQCQSFCDTADGYARGEGCGIVILKSLKAAIEDGNKIWATIKTGSNQDGSVAKPMTAPSSDQQVELLKHVYETHRFSPSDIQYIEAHGTGTPRGDPTEINALGTFFSSSRSSLSSPLLFGSVKSNIGHTESAAGIAGLIKVLLMLKHGKYVPSLHVKPDKSNVNKSIKLSEYNLDVITSVQDFPPNKNGERYACLNSFGFGGSNTHAIITTKRNRNVPTKEGNVTSQLIPIRISAVDHEALKVNLTKFQVDIRECIESQYGMSYTSFYHRDTFSFRTLVFGHDIKEIQDECKHRIGRIPDMLPKKKHNMVFVFCGVGTTWDGMCQELMRENDVFSKTIDQIDMYLKPLTGWRMRDKFLADTNYEDPFLNHVAIFCVQVALTEVWKSFGIVPDTIIGQSVGEVAAAYAANLLTLEDAVKVIHVRSEILARQCGGSMTVVGNKNIKELEDMCSQYKNKVCIAVYSSPVACTLSGSTEELSELTNSLKEDESNKDVFIRELKVKCAYHSPLLEGCMDEIKTRIDKSLKKRNSKQALDCGKPIPMISTVTGEHAVSTQMRTGSYWARNIRQPVRFMQSIKQAFDEETYTVYLEIGPRPVLRAHLSNILESASRARPIPSMLPKREVQCLYRSLSEMYELGIDIEMSSFINPTQCNLARLPKYAFNRTAELFIPTTTKEYLAGYTLDFSHMFVQTAKSATDTKFEVGIDVKSTPFVYDHFLSEKIIVPGATYVETGFHIGMELLKKPVDRLSVAFSFSKTFSPTAGRDHKLDIELKSQDVSEVQFSVLNIGNTLASGTVSDRNIPMRDSVDIEYLKVQCPNYKTKSDCYDCLGKFNFRYGESLSLIQGAWISDSETKCLTELCMPDKFSEELCKTHFHPAIIDSVFQIFGMMIKELAMEDGKQLFVVPKGVSAVVLNKPMESVMYGYGEEVRATDSSTHYNAVLLSATGAVIAEFENFYTKIISSEMKQFDKAYTYALTWTESLEFPTPSDTFRPETIILFSCDADSKSLHDLEKMATVITGTVGETVSIPECESYENTFVLYHVGGSMDNTKENETEAVYENAVKRFNDLKKLLAAIKALEVKIPIAVITENTQHCPNRQAIGYNGSELWGMLRSAVHEGTCKSMTLIDIDRENVDTEVLMRLLSSSNEDETEYALSGSKLYQPKLRTEQKRSKSKRHIASTPTEKLAIYSSRPGEITDPYLLMSSTTVALPDADSVKLDSLITHNKDIYSPALGNIETGDLLLQKPGEKDFQVIAVEGRGKSVKTDSEVIFLYPINAETTVDIPSEHMIKKSDCPIDSSGIMILTNLIVHIASAVDNGTEVAVIKLSGEIDIGQEIFMHIMKEKNCETQFLTTKELQTESVCSGIHTLIITTTLSTDKWKVLVKSLPELTKIISLNIFVPDNLRLWLKHSNPDIKLIILSSVDMLSANKIKETMPMIKECFQQFQSRNEIKESNQFLLELPMNSLNVKEKINDGTLKCFSNNKSLFRFEAVYVVVGGLTGLGWELLQLMVEMGAGVIVTLSRRTPSNDVQDEIDKLETVHNCQIVPLQTDISDLASVQKSFTEICRKFPNNPIKGIFHGAGVLADSILENLDEEKVQNVLKPKICGAWNLHLASLNCPLDYFVLHSSIVSVIGNPGQCNYAAANSFIDSFALYRRSKGLPAQSINWGALAVGMAVDNDEIKTQLKRSGFSTLDQKMIREFFLEAIVNDDTSVVFADVEWEKLLSLPTFSMASSKYSEFRSNRFAAHTKKVIELDIEELRKMDKEEQMAKIKSVLREIIHEQMIIEDEALKDDTTVTEIGIDSMAAMSLSNRIDEVFKCRISLVFLLAEGTTFATISEYIRQNFGSSMNENGDENAEEDLEAQAFFDSKDFTFMQIDLLEKYKNNRDDPYYLRVIDVELTELKFDMDDWNAILKHVMKMNPELRKRFYFSETGDVSVETMTEDCPEIDLAKIPDITLEDKHQPDIRLGMPTDIHGQLPVSFRISETETTTILRIVTHALVSDIRGLSILCRDIDETIPAYFYKTGLPERPLIDIPAAVKKSIAPRISELGRFWRRYLNLDIKPVTIGKSLQAVDDKFCKLSLVTIPQETVFEIKKYIAKVGVTLYEFIMSLYQIYLYIGTNSPIVTVGTAADMRSHVPELNNVITRCVNYVPTVAQIDDTRTITEFIKENSIGLSTTTLHGAYPNSLILNKLKTDEARENIFRHFIAMHDMTEINKVMEEENSRAKVRQVWYMRHNRETFLFVRYDLRKSWISFEIGQNTNICGQYGQRFSDYMIHLAEQAMSCGNKKICDIRGQLTGESGDWRQDILTSKATKTNGDAKGLRTIGPPPSAPLADTDPSKEKQRFITHIDVVYKGKQSGTNGNVSAKEDTKRRDIMVPNMGKGNYSQPSRTGIEHKAQQLEKFGSGPSFGHTRSEGSAILTPKDMMNMLGQIQQNGPRTPQEAKLLGNKKVKKMMDKMKTEMRKNPQEVEILKSKKVQKVMARMSKDLLNAEMERHQQPTYGLTEKTASFPNAHNSEMLHRMNGKAKNGMDYMNRDIVIAGEFEKQTSHGWDHKVHVSLCEIDGRVMLEWGKEKRIRKSKPKVFDLANVRDVFMQDFNGLPSLIINAKKKMLVLKTQDRYQAEQWLAVLQGSMMKYLAKPASTSTSFQDISKVMIK